MPYANRDQQRQANRESYARRKVILRAAAVSSEPGSEPDVSAPLPPLPPPAPADLSRVGEFLGVPRQPWEEYPDYHARLRERWREIRSLLE